MAQFLQTVSSSNQPALSSQARVCEHPGCRKAGWFGFSDGVEHHWYCTAHKDEGEDECRFERLKREPELKDE